MELEQTMDQNPTMFFIVFFRENAKEDIPEWAIIELQGDLESREELSLYNQFVGDLHFTTTGQPVLIIGHHILQGKEMTMEKPFAVLEKKVHKPDDQKLSGQTQSTQSSDLDSTFAVEHKTVSGTEYVAKALVKKKLIFKIRPKPIISQVNI